jgi:hypothetical protein
MLTKKIKLKAGTNKINATESFFVYVGTHIPKGGIHIFYN